MKKNFRLVPLSTGRSTISSKDYFEQVLLYDGKYPCAIFHIDTLYTKDEAGEPNSIYKKLESGEPVNVIVTIDEV
jgi:hypothetical protein